jgi:hypothetical protein
MVQAPSYKTSNKKEGNKMILRQTLRDPINGYWDGGKKSVFEWAIDKHRIGHDSRGSYVRVGSWSANHWFHVALGKTDKQTLSNAKRRLRAYAKQANTECSFEYIE